MEPGRESGSSSVDFRTGATANSGEGERYSSREEQLGPSASGSTSQDQFHSMPTTSLSSELHDTSLEGSKIVITPFGEAHHSSASPSQNPFLISGATTAEKRHDRVTLEPGLHQLPNGSIENNMFGTYPNNAFSGEISSMHSSLSLGNPFEAPPAPQDASESQGGYWSMPSGGKNPLGESHFLPSSAQQSEPFFTMEESSQKQQLPNATDHIESHRIASSSSNLGDPINASQKVEVNCKSAPESVSEKYSSVTAQNPLVQVMERPGDPPPPAAASASSSNYAIPSHVFSRNRSSAGQWSNSSNESLFSIQMGNMSFSTDVACYAKSGELEKPPLKTCKEKEGTESFPLPPQPPPPANKFDGVGQGAAQRCGGETVTEERAAETMREVIMEGGLSVANGVPHRISHSNSNDHSNHSDGSTKSYAFRLLKDGGHKTLSRKHVEGKQQQQQQGIKETPNASQTSKSTVNNASSQKKWLSCFACCR